MLITDEGIRAAEHEQWDDGNDYLAVAPGVILGYDRGGPRCMTCPIERDPAFDQRRLRWTCAGAAC